MLHVQISTIVFQVLNFLILLAVLSRFLYRPLLRVMREREEAIDARLREAEEKGRAAEAERARLENEHRGAVLAAETLLASARKAAADERQAVLEAGRTEVDRMTGQARDAVAEQERRALDQTEHRVREAAISIAGALIRDAAGLAVHEQLVARFCTEGFYRDQGEQARAIPIPVLPNRPIEIQLAYPPGKTIETDLRTRLARDLDLPQGGAAISFSVEPALLAGLRVVAGEFVWDFSLRHTLERLSGAEDTTEPAT